MKKLLLAALSEAKDFDEFKAIIIPVLELAIKEENAMREEFERLRHRALGITPASLVAALPASAEETNRINQTRRTLGRDLTTAENQMIEEYGDDAIKAICR